MEWDCSSHGQAYQMWEQAMFADGGSKCRQLTESSGEPLLEGLIVGTDDTKLSIAEAESVSSHIHPNSARKQADHTQLVWAIENRISTKLFATVERGRSWCFDYASSAVGQLQA